MNNTTYTNSNNQPSTPKWKRIAALVAIVILVLLYLVTLVLAIADPTSSGRFFQAALFATIAVPLITWIYIWLFGLLTRKKTVADFDPFAQEFEAAKKDASNQADEQSPEVDSEQNPEE